MNELLPDRDIVLLGAGHTHAHIVRMWQMNPIPDVRLTLVSDHSVATYSGMLAGVLSGQYDPKRMEIDLVRLCASCGVRFVQGDVVGHDVEGRRLLLKDRPAVRYDLLSIGIGSRPAIPTNNEGGLSIKPMQTFLPRLKDAIKSAVKKRSEGALRFAIVGGGAAGVEIACCLRKFLQRSYTEQSGFEIVLIEADRQILGEMPQRTRQLAMRELERVGIQVKLNSRVKDTGADGCLTLEDGQELNVDIVLWATAARAPSLLSQLNLPLDKNGFLLTRNTLQSTGCEEVFAVGDTGTVEGEQYAKAGVYAVRQGPVLWENLRKMIQDQPLSSWQPQSQFLSLLNTGNNQAVFTYRGLSFHAGWCWRLKDWIDSRFMDKYQQYEGPMNMAAENGSTDSKQVMQCGGCGSKASASVLIKSLPTLKQPDYDHVLLGLDPPDDVALLQHGAGPAIAASTDFFSAFVDDPFLLGRIAALNALSDLYAKGAMPRSALSIAVLPQGSDQQQAQLLQDLLAGAVREFEPVGVPIVGGHSIMGSKLTFGFTVLGEAEPKVVMRKASLSDGDCLILTKPLGTGVLLAAHMQAACRALWWTPLIDMMLRSNRDAAALAAEVRVSAATDVTGFGLANHLLEMLSPSGLSAELSLEALPLLPGARKLIESGYESTLTPGNRDSCDSVEIAAELVEKPVVNMLFDPQTSGGLLLSVPSEKVEELLAKCGGQSAMIGRVVKSDQSGTRIRLRP